MINLLFPILLPIEVALPGALLFALPTMLPVASRWCAQPKLRLPYGFLCRNCAFKVLLVAKLRLQCASCGKTGSSGGRACRKRAQKPRFCARKARKRGFRRAKAHKNLDFVLEMPENGGSEGQKSTKTPILCSKWPKMRVPDGKSAQKLQFCARKARKRGFRRPKKHKNADFVLGKKGNGIGKPAVRGN